MSEPTMASRMAATLRPENLNPVMFQEWQDLLFLHWEYNPQAIQETLPKGLSVDTFNGRAYIGVLPFVTLGARPRFLPALPGLSEFPQINFRTYVYDEHSVPGVWFYSLDAGQRIAAALARMFFGLPFVYAKMSVEKDAGGEIRFTSQRPDAPAGLHSLFRYRGMGAARRSEPGSLEFFLAERYVLFSRPSNSSQLRSGRVHHRSYALLDAEVLEWTEALFSLNGFDPPNRPPDQAAMSLHVNAAIYPLQDTGKSLAVRVSRLLS